MSATAPHRTIIRDGIAVGIATGAYGISFGAISVAAGLTVLQTCALSLLVFTGASQFALVGVVAAGGAALSGALTALLLGTRNTLYGLRLAPLLGWTGWRRAAAAQILSALIVAEERDGFSKAGEPPPPGVGFRHLATERYRFRVSFASAASSFRYSRMGRAGVPQNTTPFPRITEGS